MRHRFIAMSALLMTSPAALSAQEALGPGPGRVFVARQTSWWAADGLPPSDVVAHDSTFIFKPDSLHPWPSFGTVPMTITIRGTPRRVSMVASRNGGVGEVLTSAAEMNCDQSFHSTTSALAAMSLTMIVPLRDGGENSRPFDPLTIAICTDTLTVQTSRYGNPRRSVDATRRPVFVSHRVHLTSSQVIETNLHRRGTALRTELIGSVWGRALMTEEFLLDSLDLKGELRGSMTYANPDGDTNNVYGTLVVRIVAAWGEDPRALERKRGGYFVVHGRYPDDVSLQLPEEPFAELAELADTSIAALDSLVRLRREANDPKTRADVDRAILSVDRRTNPALLAVLLAEPTRVAPRATLLAVPYGYQGADSMLGTDAARWLIRELVPRLVMRRRLVAREGLFTNALGVITRSAGFVPEAGPLFMDAARSTDDPWSRDLLYLGAYQSDPTRYRDEVASLVNPTLGYGPVVLGWMAGDQGATYSSWGVREEDDFNIFPFPGVDATPQALTEYFDHVKQRGGLDAARMRLRSEGRDLTEDLRARFLDADDHDTRAAVAHYLRRLADTTAWPWLRTLLVGSDEERTLAYDLLRPQAVTDSTTLTELQSMLIGYIVGDVSIEDTAGNAIEDPWVHDERPDLRILVSDNILPVAIEPWFHLFQVMTRDSVMARVPADGMQMGWVLDPIRKTGDRYYTGVTLRPYGRRCNCGGGVSFEFERRDGGWVVVRSSRWIS